MPIGKEQIDIWGRVYRLAGLVTEAGTDKVTLFVNATEEFRGESFLQINKQQSQETFEKQKRLEPLELLHYQ